MLCIESWQSGINLTLAESRGGVRVTSHPLENMVQYANLPSSTPELLQKFHASHLFQGRNPEDDRHARDGLGYYCDLQSLNSEDAVTWSFFGTLAYMSAEIRHRICVALFNRLDLPAPEGNVLIWLWRRIPHPEKPQSSGGPEIDFGLLSAESLVLGEAKWKSPVGTGQGINKNRSQLDLRLAYCEQLAPKALPSVHNRVVLGVGRQRDVFPTETRYNFATVQNLSWYEIATLYPTALAAEFERYLAWRAKYAKAAT